MRLESDIDIISCATDTIAAGVIEAIAQLSPQRSIQVTGFGDNQFLKAVTGGNQNRAFRISDKWCKRRQIAVGYGRIRKGTHDRD